MRLNVTVEQDWENAMAQIRERYGPLNVLVSNAGVSYAFVTGTELVIDGAYTA